MTDLSQSTRQFPKIDGAFTAIIVIYVCVALFLQFQGGKEGSTDSNQPSGTNATTATNQPATNAKAP